MAEAGVQSRPTVPRARGESDPNFLTLITFPTRKGFFGSLFLRTPLRSRVSRFPDIRYRGLGQQALCSTTASLPGAAYLPRGSQGPIHVEETERGHFSSQKTCQHRERHPELYPELPGPLRALELQGTTGRCPDGSQNTGGGYKI